MIIKEKCTVDAHDQISVTFILPAGLSASKITLVGDFNDWNRTSHPLRQNHNGDWVIVLELEPNRAYQFRYLIDNQSWTNDDNADAYVRNLHGSDNFVVFTDPNFQIYDGH